MALLTLGNLFSGAWYLEYLPSQVSFEFDTFALFITLKANFILFSLVSLHKGISVHFISFSIGVLVASHFFYLNTTYMLVFAALAYTILRVVQKCVGTHRGVVMAVFSLTFNTMW